MEAESGARPRAYVYDSRAQPDHVRRVLDNLPKSEGIRILDVGDAADTESAVREAMFVVKGAVRIGSAPDELFDESGSPDFSPGVLVTEAPTGRRSMYIGDDAETVICDSNYSNR